jgi:hypothetical protein
VIVARERNGTGFVRSAEKEDDRTTTDAASSVPLRSVAPSETDVATSDAASSVPFRSSAVSDALDWMIDAAISVPLRSSPDADAMDAISADIDVPARLVGNAAAVSTASDCDDTGFVWLRSSADSDVLDWMIDAASSVPCRSSAVDVRNVLHSATGRTVWLRSSADSDALDWMTEAAASLPLASDAVRETTPGIAALRLVPVRATAVSDVDAEAAAATSLGPPLEVSRRVSVTDSPHTHRYPGCCRPRRATWGWGSWTRLAGVRGGGHLRNLVLDRVRNNIAGCHRERRG